MFCFLKSTLPSLFLLATTPVHAAATVTADDIIAGIAAVDSAVVLFRTHIEAWQGGYLSQGPQYPDLLSIITTTAAVDAQANLILHNFTQSDSTRIVYFYTSSIGVDIVTTGQAILDKKDLIIRMGEGEAFATAERTFQAGNDELARALGGRLTSEVGRFEGAARGIHEALQRGIDAFSIL